jgi:dCMP deaminase
MKIPIDLYMLIIAKTTALRSTCPRRSVGAVLVKERRVISMGYNGSPPSYRQCNVDGCLLVDGHCINTIHAEMNALMRAREVGDTLYCTDEPCIMCLKAALSHNPGIRIVCSREYHDPLREAFREYHGVNNIELAPEKWREFLTLSDTLLSESLELFERDHGLE